MPRKALKLNIQNRLQKYSLTALQDDGLVVVVDVLQLAFDRLVLATSLFLVWLKISDAN